MDTAAMIASHYYNTPELIRERLRELDGWVGVNSSLIAEYEQRLEIRLAQDECRQRTLAEISRLKEQTRTVKAARQLLAIRLTRGG